MNKVMFLPTDYEAPKTSNFYMKFLDGENKFRILSQPIMGWEDWHDKKPIRFKFNEKPIKSFDAKKPVKHFWSMIVWNYQCEEIQILHLTQATLRKNLEALCKDPDWGAPYFYDIKVIKTGEGMDTEYSLNPLPHKPIPLHIKDLFNERRCYLEALFLNEDPFSKEHTQYTPGIFSEGDMGVSLSSPIVNNKPKISMEAAYDLDMILDECDPKYKEWVFGYIKKQFNTESLSEIPLEMFDQMKAAAIKNMEKNHEKQRTQLEAP